MLALEQVSVIMILREQTREVNKSKDNKSVVKTPSSVPMVKISLKHCLELFGRI